MKILFLTRLFYPHIGGVEKHVEEVTKRLRDKDIKVKIITTKYDKNLADRKKINGTEVLRFYQPNIKFISLFITWLWFFRNINLIKESDIVHIHDVFIWYLPFRFLFPSKPVYTTFHGRWGKYPIPLKDIIQKRIGSKLSKGNLCIGDYIPKHYGFKEDFLSYGATEIPKNYPKKDEKLIIYVGRLDKDIALDKIFKIFSKLNDYKIEFCGDGELKKECSKYGKVHGWINPFPLMAKAKYCFASGYLTILEALVHKCLVFTASSNPLQKDYYKLTPFSELITYSSEPSEILKDFKYYSVNSKAAQKRIDKGYNWAKKQTWENLSKTYLKLWGVKEK